MDSKQKEELRILLKSSRRAKKVLAKRKAADRERRAQKMRQMSNFELMNQYSQELDELAQESTILPLIEVAALQLGARLKREVNYYLYYGMGVSSLQQTDQVAKTGQMRASYVSLLLTWGDGDVQNEVEVRVHMNGLITFSNSLLPIFPFIWRRNPHILQRMLALALEHPRQRPASIRKSA